MQFSYDDDVVTRAFKQMHILLLGAVFSWIVSYVLIMIQVATKGKFSHYVWPLFAAWYRRMHHILYSCLLQREINSQRWESIFE